MFLNTLDNLLNKWYKIEAKGQSSQWKELREIFIKDFEFKRKKPKLNDVVQKIKEKPINHQKSPVDASSTCDYISCTLEQKMASNIEMEETLIVGQICCLNKNHLGNHKRIQLIYKVDKQKVEKLDKSNFPSAYQETNVREKQLNESKACLLLASST